MSGVRQKITALGRCVRTFLLDTVYPENALCRACGTAVKTGCLCDACRERLRNDGAAFSWMPRQLDGVSAYALRRHEGLPRALVIRLKHHAEACVAAELAALVRPVPAFLSFPENTVVTWVTMPRSRRRECCIDHGQCLAAAVARELGLDCAQLLLRTDSRGKTQASLNREKRERNLERVFAPAGPIRRPVLLVDDVMTTGTTARRCIAALREGGATDITVLTVTCP